MAVVLMAAARAGSDLFDMSRTAQPLRAVVAGSGFAAAEAVLALRP